MYLPSLLQRASQRTLKREDQVTGAGRCHVGPTLGIAEASNEAIAAGLCVVTVGSEPSIKLTVAINATNAPAKIVRTRFAARGKD